MKNETNTANEYDQQADTFLSRHGLKFRATLSDSKTPAWAKEGEETGHHYRITIAKKPDYTLRDQRGAGYKLPERRLVFDFWGSVADARKGVTTATAYDVLACISGDAFTPETFADFCAEYGYESDSIKALQQFRRCDRFAKRLRAFFSEAELTELSEIR